ncbi:MAG TPA: hypothetical protein VF857_07635, partial [Spirochaetota bacterium]
QLNGATNYYRSQTNALQSIAAFDQFLNSLNRYFITRKNSEKHVPSITLLFHSMGGFILQKYAESGSAEIDSPVFNNVILDAAAVKQKNHYVWLERVAFQKRIYVLSNGRDFTLHGASLLSLGKMLGMGARKQLAENAEYIDFSENLTFEHNYTILDEGKIGKKFRYVCETIMHGRSLDLENRNIFTPIGTTRVYKLVKESPDDNVAESR